MFYLMEPMGQNRKYAYVSSSLPGGSIGGVGNNINTSSFCYCITQTVDNAVVSPGLKRGGANRNQ